MTLQCLSKPLKSIYLYPLLCYNKTMLNYIIWLLVAGLYSPILYQLYSSRWETIDYTHAYFILPISLWLVWRMRSRLASLIKNSSITNKPRAYSLEPTAILLIIFGLFLFIFGWRWDFLSVSTFSLFPLLFGIILYLYGTAFAKALTFPILYLLLIVPPPLGILDSITMPMRYGISIATKSFLKLFHYPITRDGLLLSISGNEIYMGAPCSGFRSLITMISLGLIYAYLNKGKFTKKALLVISVVPLALIGNFIRVTGMCLVTHYLGQNAGHKFHDTSGYVIFLFLIFGLIGIDFLLDKIKPGWSS